MKCPICMKRPGSGHRGWCLVCLSNGPKYVSRSGYTLPHVRDHEAMDWAEWAAKRSRAALLSTARRQTHAMNINVVGALTDLRDAVLNAKPPGISLQDLQRLARRAKGKPIEPVADVQKRARAAKKEG